MTDHAQRGPDGHFLPDDDESVCTNCREPYPTEFAQEDGMCNYCRPDPEEALRKIAHSRALADGSILDTVGTAMQAEVLAQLQKLHAEGRRATVIFGHVVLLD